MNSPACNLAPDWRVPVAGRGDVYLPLSAKAIAVILGLGVCCGAMATVCAAQSEIGGSVAGRVAGPGGAGLAGAEVRIENAATGEGASGASDSRGEFQFADLEPGEYTLRVRVPGLSDWEADHVLVGLGTATRLHPSLSPLTLHRTVLVDGQVSREKPAAGEDAGVGERNAQ